MAHRSRGYFRNRRAISPSLTNVAPGHLVPGTARTGHEIRVTPERAAKMGRAALGLPLHGLLDVASRRIGVKHLLFFRGQHSTWVPRFARGDAALEHRQCAVDARHHFLFSQNF